MDNNMLEAMIEHRCSVGYVARIIIRGIVCSIRLVDPRSIVLKRRIQLGMLVITFLGFIQLWKTSVRIIKHLSLRWMVIFVIKLFLF